MVLGQGTTLYILSCFVNNFSAPFVVNNSFSLIELTELKDIRLHVLNSAEVYYSYYMTKGKFCSEYDGAVCFPLWAVGRPGDCFIH